MGKQRGATGLEPVCLALVLCDYVHIDPITSRRSMLGAFYEIDSPRFPMVYPKMAVYVAVTDGRGKIPLTIRMIDVDESDEPIWSDTQDVNFEDPQRVKELVIEILNVPFQDAGIYRLQLLAGNATILERSVFLHETPAQEE